MNSSKVVKVFFPTLKEFFDSDDFKEIKKLPSLMSFASVYPYARPDKILFIHCGNSEITKITDNNRKGLSYTWYEDNVKCGDLNEFIKKKNDSIIIEVHLFNNKTDDKKYLAFIHNITTIDKNLDDISNILISNILLEQAVREDNLILTRNEIVYDMNLKLLHLIDFSNDLHLMICYHRYSAARYTKQMKWKEITHIKIKFTCFGCPDATIKEFKINKYDDINRNVITKEYYIALPKVKRVGVVEDTIKSTRIGTTKYVVPTITIREKGTGRYYQMAVNSAITNEDLFPLMKDEVAFYSSRDIPSNIVIFSHIVKPYFLSKIAEYSDLDYIKEEAWKDKKFYSDKDIKCPCCDKILSDEYKKFTYHREDDVLKNYLGKTYLSGSLKYDLVVKLTCDNLYCDTRAADRARVFLKKIGLEIDEDWFDKIINSKRYNNPVDFLNPHEVMIFKKNYAKQKRRYYRDIYRVFEKHGELDLFIASLPFNRKNVNESIRSVFKMIGGVKNGLSKVLRSDSEAREARNLLGEMNLSDYENDEIGKAIKAHNMEVYQVNNEFRNPFVPRHEFHLNLVPNKTCLLGDIRIKTISSRTDRSQDCLNIINILKMNGAKMAHHASLERSFEQIITSDLNSPNACCLILIERSDMNNITDEKRNALMRYYNNRMTRLPVYFIDEFVDAFDLSFPVPDAFITKGDLIHDTQ